MTTAPRSHYREITFNIHEMDPCPRGTCTGLFPPASARHHNVPTAAHEIGHALGLDHTTDMGALEFMDIRNFFIRGVVGPTADEINGLVALGYSSCN